MIVLEIFVISLDYCKGNLIVLSLILFPLLAQKTCVSEWPLARSNIALACLWFRRGSIDAVVPKLGLSSLRTWHFSHT